MRRIKILIADDHTIVRQGMRRLLEGYPDLEVVGESQDGDETVAAAERLAPELVIMDISMPGFSGLEATRKIKKKYPAIKIVILTVHAEKEYIFQILQSGASGYLLKGSPIEELVTAIRAVDRGESYLSPPVSKSIIESYVTGRGVRAQTAVKSQSLTTREREVLRLIAEGHTSKSIAGRLSLSSKTIETHRSHIMQKLNIHNAAGLIRYAIQKGWVGIAPSAES
ncbi:MAG: response regulator transcription factor [Nitrospirae bacterium]|nr:response regulator transcription factor [Candidatus Manganitrophaceae bacterium]